jgi:hypothetical protein
LRGAARCRCHCGNWTKHAVERTTLAAGFGDVHLILPSTKRRPSSSAAAYVHIFLAVQAMAKKPRAPNWTLAELKILRQCHPNMRLAARRLPERTAQSIRTRSKLLGLGRRKTWRHVEEDLIRKLHLTHTDAQLAAMLGRSEEAVALHRSGLMGLRRVRTPSAESALLDDLRDEARRRGIKLWPLARGLLGASVKLHGTGPAPARAVARVVEVLGGELYAEWED